MNRLESWPQPEGENNDIEHKALGLELEDIPEDLDSKEELISTLIEKLREEEGRDGRIKQLHSVHQELGPVRTFLIKEGNSLDLIKQIDEMQEKIERATAN